MSERHEPARLAIIGVGKLGEALLSGVLSAGWDPSTILVHEAIGERAAQLAARYGVRVAADVRAAAAGASAVLVAVKPADTAAVAGELGAAGAAGDRPLVISAAAGVPASAYESRLPVGSPVVRVMPNTPALVGEGMTAISAGAWAGAADLGVAREVFGAVGSVLEVPESQLDAVTAISGSGPAYIFLLAEALTEAGAALGLPAEVAAQLAIQTIVGAGVMLRDSGDDAATLRAAVTSPGGTTAAALEVFAGRDLRGIVAQAAAAAATRSAELGAQFGG
jgi:pyrroline-5-carboxylate reductase